MPTGCWCLKTALFTTSSLRECLQTTLPSGAIMECRRFHALLKKDLRLIVRAPHTTASILGFAVLAVVITSFAFRESGLTAADLRRLSAGVLWLIFLFSSA